MKDLKKILLYFLAMVIGMIISYGIMQDRQMIANGSSRFDFVLDNIIELYSTILLPYI